MDKPAAEKLAATIINQAVKDYCKNPELRGGVTRFFRSAWGQNLLNHFNIFDTEIIIEKMKESVKKQGIRS